MIIRGDRGEMPTAARAQPSPAMIQLPLCGSSYIVTVDLPPLNGTTSRERIWEWSKPREATNATRKEGTG
jgi:hypothetical protein